MQGAEHLAEQVGAVDRLAGLELDRGGQGDRQLVEGLGDVDARPRPPRPGPVGVSIRSTRIPASLRSSTSTSLGHFRAMSGSRSASAACTAYPVSSGSHGQSCAGRSGRSSTEKVSELRAGVSHTRSSRPRPAVWCSVTTTRPSSSPARARSATTALVDGVASVTSTRQPGGATRRSGSSAGRGAGTEVMGTRLAHADNRRPHE